MIGEPNAVVHPAGRRSRHWGLLMCLALAALGIAGPWMTPHRPGDQFAEFVYAPPMIPRVIDAAGRPRAPFVYPLVLEDRLARRYAEDQAAAFRSAGSARARWCPWILIGPRHGSRSAPMLSGVISSPASRAALDCPWRRAGWRAGGARPRRVGREHRGPLGAGNRRPPDARVRLRDRPARRLRGPRASCVHASRSDDAAGLLDDRARPGRGRLAVCGQRRPGDRRFGADQGVRRSCAGDRRKLVRGCCYGTCCPPPWDFSSCRQPCCCRRSSSLKRPCPSSAWASASQVRAGAPCSETPVRDERWWRRPGFSLPR